MRTQGDDGLKPSYRLTVNGIDIGPTVNGRLISLTLTENRGLEADTLNLTLTDHDNALQLPPRGAAIEVAIGWEHEGLIDKGMFTVDEISYSGSPDQLSIRARSVNMRTSLPTQKSRSWHETTLGEIVRTIAAEHGLEPVIGNSLANEAVPHRDQTAQSDMDFLSHLAHHHDALVTVKGNHLLFIPAGTGHTASGTPLPTAEIHRHDGDQYSYSVADRNSYTGVRAYWNDLAEGEQKEILVGEEANAKELRPIFASEEEALTEARSELKRLQRGTAEFSMTLAVGRPQLLVETPIRARGFKAAVDQTPWVALRVTHTLNDAGYVTDFDAEQAN
ncbi:late control protein [Alkalilimnicola ehrlichii]|uniref:Late control protein n=1 Tax=Alkalilimnicola ehrlichii TaxID=351052 RepID=A0A3E0X405_9GAMM|nr:contractile injection system protein, VgrG/Pvc8 family [Alkalilimnicola ehrlichii]RFA31321.1 late control protein [Alkalilimnicola ehrlichii]RFA39405.1 late control protein [Alkalilimnicola ehrlichii]